MNVRRAASAVVLAALLVPGAAACGSGTPDGGPRKDPVGSTPPVSSGPATPSDTTTAPPTTTAPATAPPTTTPPSDSKPPATTPATPVTGSIADRVVYFSSSSRAPRETHEVLRDRAALERFAATVAKNDDRAAAKITASGAATDFTRNVLVGWAESTGCSAATSAVLLGIGDTLKLHVVQPKPSPECFTDFRVTVVFEVPKDRIPARPVFR